MAKIFWFFSFRITIVKLITVSHLVLTSCKRTLSCENITIRWPYLKHWRHRSRVFRSVPEAWPCWAVRLDESGGAARIYTDRDSSHDKPSGRPGRANPCSSRASRTSGCGVGSPSSAAFSASGKLIKLINWKVTQECIPVGCVPPASMAISGGGGSAQGDVSAWWGRVCLGGVSATHPLP